MICLKNVCVTYNDFVAVNNINFNINRGEFFTLLGPSGCGKTTVLRAIAGFEKLTTGQVIIEEEDVSNQRPEDRRIGFVFQNYALFPTMTVFENIAFGLKIRRYSVKVINEEVEKIAGLIGISNCLDKKTFELSGGQQQRVAFARALVLKPKILLLDEPLSNLDAKLRVVIREEIKKLQRELGITTIYVTHDQEEALALSDRIAVFNYGKIEQIGQPAKIYREPKSEFVAGFIGEINYLNLNLIKRINKEFNLKLNEDLKFYVRSEHVIATNSNRSEKGYIVLPARVVNVEFLGACIKTTFDIDFNEIKGLSFDNKDCRQSNSELFIKINIDDLITFKA